MITYAIIAITAIVSVITFKDRNLFGKMAFHPYSIKHNNQGYRFLTYGLLHADWSHLIINMFVLYSFGLMVEDYYKYLFEGKGEFYYLLLYMGALALSVIPSFGKHKDDYNYNAVGASGAVTAVIFASIVFEPLNKIFVFFIPLPIPAILFGLLYLIYSVYMSKRNIDNVGHDAHFWGAIFGIVFTIALKPMLISHLIDTISSVLRGQ
jgi:membrane associated rhomboid family serine protease